MRESHVLSQKTIPYTATGWTMSKRHERNFSDDDVWKMFEVFRELPKIIEDARLSQSLWEPGIGKMNEVNDLADWTLVLELTL